MNHAGTKCQCSQLPQLMGLLCAGGSQGLCLQARLGALRTPRVGVIPGRELQQVPGQQGLYVNKRETELLLRGENGQSARHPVFRHRPELDD